MNAQQEAVALWKFLESRGLHPSVRSVGRALRDHGLKFRDTSLREWLSQFSDAARPHGAESRDAQNKHAGRSGQEPGTQPGRGFARAAKVSLPSKSLTPTEAHAPKRRRMKQPALDLGEATPPEIDFDRRRLDMPEGLRIDFPEPLDELRELAETFCRAFAYCKNEKAVANNLNGYMDTLALFRQYGNSVHVAWQAFRDAVLAQGGKPLFKAQAKKALAYRPNTRRPFTPNAGPRVDSCGCPLPPGVSMPRLQKGETAHWDGDEFLFGSDSDPR